MIDVIKTFFGLEIRLLGLVARRGRSLHFVMQIRQSEWVAIQKSLG